MKYLEESLRKETLTNEEQRAYIDILKNIIYEKLESEGIL